MSHQWKQDEIKKLTVRIKKSGYRVFLAKSGTYGFYTDNEGSRVVSFQIDFDTTFSGNYKTDNPRFTGTGWRIADSDTGNYKEIFNSYAPQWALNGSKWRFTTLDEHLDMYNKSSQYTEV